MFGISGTDFTILIAFFLVAAVPLAWIFFSELRLRRQRARDFSEDLIDPTGEPQPIRELNDGEKEYLVGQDKIAAHWANLEPILVPVFILFLAISIYAIVKNYYTPRGSEGKLVIAIAALFVYWMAREGKVYKDLRSGVLGAHGELLKRLEGLGRDEEKIFIIQSVWFSDRENPQVDENWDEWQDGDKIYVEYSPFTKHIWKIAKV